MRIVEGAVVIVNIEASVIIVAIIFSCIDDIFIGETEGSFNESGWIFLGVFVIVREFSWGMKN